MVTEKWSQILGGTAASPCGHGGTQGRGSSEHQASAGCSAVKNLWWLREWAHRCGPILKTKLKEQITLISVLKDDLLSWSSNPLGVESLLKVSPHPPLPILPQISILLVFSFVMYNTILNHYIIILQQAI